LISLNHSIAFHSLCGILFAAYENRKIRLLVLWCIGSVDKKLREKENDRDASNEDTSYQRYMANNGVQPLIMKRDQADYLNTFSLDARLFYLAFTFVDGDGIDNGIGRNIVSYVGNTLGEANERKRALKEKLNLLEWMLTDSIEETSEEFRRCEEKIVLAKRELSQVI
jgi:hypothetical protein